MAQFKFLALWLLGTLVLSNAMYSSTDDVVQLTSATFNDKVVNSKDLWYVEFYAPWCGHCKNLAPEWIKAAKALKGIVNVGAVNMDGADQSVGAPYNIRGFPTIKVFGSNKNSPSDYQGARTAQGIVDDAISQLGKLARERLGGSSGSSGGSKSGGSGGSKTNEVVKLTDSNFQKMVLESNDIWLVEFFAPWCGHCKNLEPEWAKAASELKGKVKLGALDATENKEMAQRYGVNGYPTIKYFGAGSKTSPTDYDAGRTSSDIVTWALNKYAENAPAPEVNQLLSQEQLSNACDDKQLCIISFMPNLLDCQSKCRKNYLDLVRKMGDTFKRHQWSWLWAESNQHPDLENSLSVGGFGYPAIVAVNSRKGKFMLQRGSFSQSGINEFLRDVAMGRGSSETIYNGGKLPEIKTVEKWDGKDAKMEQEEEIDLSDVVLDDDESIPIRRKSADEL